MRPPLHLTLLGMLLEGQRTGGGFASPQMGQVEARLAAGRCLWRTRTTLAPPQRRLRSLLPPPLLLLLLRLLLRDLPAGTGC